MPFGRVSHFSIGNERSSFEINSLKREELRKILDLELYGVQQRINEGTGERFYITATETAKEFLLSEGIELRYGARHLKRAVERFVVNPLANLSATGQVRLGDVVVVDLNDESGKPTFYRDEAETSRAAAAAERLRADMEQTPIAA